MVAKNCLDQLSKKNTLPRDVCYKVEVVTFVVGRGQRAGTWVMCCQVIKASKGTSDTKRSLHAYVSSDYE